MKHRDRSRSSTARSRPFLRWLARLRRDQQGASLIEQVLIMGVAVVGMVGFSRFGTEVHDDLDREAQHVRGRGSASAALSLGALAGSYRPQLPTSRGTPSGAAVAPSPGRDPAGRASAGDGASGGRGTPGASAGGGSAGAGSAQSRGISAGDSNDDEDKPRVDLECGDHGRYQADLGANSRAKTAPRVPQGSDLERDHIPQGHSLRVRAQQLLRAEIRRRVRAEMSARCRHLTPEEEARIVSAVVEKTAAAVTKNMNKMVENQGFTVAVPHPFHENGRTHSNSSLAESEAGDLAAAANADMQHYLDILDDEVRRGSISEECADLLRGVFAQRMSVSKEEYDAELRNIMLNHLQKKLGTLSSSLEKQFKQEEKCQ
jgi:Flp pilus assembly pilin Flp